MYPGPSPLPSLVPKPVFKVTAYTYKALAPKSVHTSFGGKVARCGGCNY